MRQRKPGTVQYTSIFAKMGRDLGINPLFPMSVALQESGWNLVHVFGTNSASNGQPLNNLFGLTKAGGNNIPFPNVQASADYWEKDWGSYVANRATTIQGFTSDLTSNAKHMYNSNSNWPGNVQDRYKQLQQATKDCGTKF